MSKKELRQDESYIWYGMFGFAGPEDDLTFSGQVSYSQVDGIRVRILNRDDKIFNINEAFACKMMHAAVSDASGLYHLTLFNVFLGNRQGNGDVVELSGSAEMLVDTWVHNTSSVLEVRVEYGKAFEDFLFWRSDRDRSVIKLANVEPCLLSSGCEIAFSDNSTATFLRDEDDLDSIFWADDSSAIEKLKGASADLFRENAGRILHRKSLRLYMVLKHPSMTLSLYLQTLGQWESFVSFLIDDRVVPLSTLITFEDSEAWKPNTKRCARAVFGYQSNDREQLRDPQHHHRLPVNYSTFLEKKGEFSLERISKAFERWITICEEPDWRPISRSIQRSRHFKDYFGDTPQFVSNFSDISTFLSVTEGSRRGLPEEMIRKYASDEWKLAVRRFFPYAKNDGDLDKFLGEQLKAVRNSIEHPADDEKNGRSFHRALRENNFKMHLINAYVTGLLLKGVLQHLGIDDEGVRERFLNKFVETHGDFSPITFSD